MERSSSETTRRVASKGSDGAKLWQRGFPRRTAPLDLLQGRGQLSESMNATLQNHKEELIVLCRQFPVRRLEAFR